MKPTTSTARRLRMNMTDAEKRLWSQLRGRTFDGLRFRRQAPIGRYIVDFVCYERKLIVELDGGQHAMNKTSDARRAAWLESQGFRVLRFWNNDILANTDGVMTAIRIALSAPDEG